MDIRFYFLARRANHGRQIDFIVHNGSRDGQKIPLGIVSFTPAEWERFRPFVVGGMRAAGFARIPIEFQDQTRTEEGRHPNLKLVH